MSSAAAPRAMAPKPRVVAFIVLTWVMAIAATAYAWNVYGPFRDYLAFAAILVLAGAAFRLHSDVGSAVGLSFASIVMLASVVLVGPVGAAIAGGLAVLCEPGRRRLSVRLFNIAMTALYGALGGIFYLLVGGLADPALAGTPVRLLTGVAMPMLVADFVQCLVNAVMLAGIIRLDRGVRFLAVVGRLLSTSGIAYVGYGVIGFLLVVLWVSAGVGPLSAALIIAPLAVAQWAFRQFGEEQDAQERTLGALVAAAERWHPYARGHGSRVAAVAARIGTELQLSPAESDALRYAALLHDVGLVDLNARIQADEPTPEQLRHLAGHVDLSAVVAAEVTFLRSSIEGIRHHHERFDGRGYPDGLAGSDIPLHARIIAVADVFDSMTVSRPGMAGLTTEQAVQVARARAGELFDPEVVEALARATAAVDWELPAVVGDSAVARSDWFDHDSVEASDRWAALVDSRRERVEP